MRNHSDNPMWNCPDDRPITHFFQNIYLNNVFVVDNNESKSEVARTYDCLISGRGDVAIVDLHPKNDSYKFRNLRKICIDKPKYFNEECILTWTSLGSVILFFN